MYNFWHASTWLTPKKRGVYYRWLLIKSSQKRFFKKIVKKFFFVRFQQIFSPELKTLARFCKNQLRHQWSANDRPLWKRVRNFNFFRNIVIKFLNFDLNFEKFLKNFLKFKTRKNLKLIFWPENCFARPVVNIGQSVVLTKCWKKLKVKIFQFLNSFFVCFWVWVFVVVGNQNMILILFDRLWSSDNIVITSTFDCQINKSLVAISYNTYCNMQCFQPNGCLVLDLLLFCLKKGVVIFDQFFQSTIWRLSSQTNYLKEG